jgi:hypothetical protein
MNKSAKVVLGRGLIYAEVRLGVTDRAPAATGLNRHSPGSASPPGLSTSALGQDLGFARKRPLSQCWIEDPVPYVEIRSCPNSNGGTTEAD